eukprot:831964-Alexandrium_andersonii.AAC.1
MAHAGAHPCMRMTAPKLAVAGEAKLPSSPSTCAGYGITDAQCEFQSVARCPGEAAVDANAAARSSSLPWALRQ